MTLSKTTVLAFAGALILSSGAAFSQGDSGALLDVLVRKKVLTAQEAEDVRLDLVRENAATTAGKINLSNSITSLKLYGDLRLRYQYDNLDPQVPQTLVAADLNPDGTVKHRPTEHGAQSSRERFRLRLNADFELGPQFFGGVQLQTAAAPDSGNQTFGDSSAAGGSGFGNYGIYISRAFVGYRPYDWLTVVGGKQPNPFYTTDLVWDPDINPDGITERIDFHKLFNGSGETITGYSKDGKAVVTTSSVRTELPWELSLVAGQFFYSNNSENDLGSDFKTDAWLFDTQLIGSYKVTKNVKVTFAPGFLTYIPGNAKNLTNSTPFQNGLDATTKPSDIFLTGTYAHAVTRDLAIITAPGDVSFKVGGIKMKALWDFAYNTQGAQRGTNLYGMGFNVPVRNGAGVITGYTDRNHTRILSVNNKAYVGSLPATAHTAQDDIAWLAGFQVGENKKAGDWSVLANFRQTGLCAVDPNLNDSDFALSYLNTQGIKTSLAYSFTDFCVGAVTYYSTWNLRNNLIGPEATANQKIANENAAQVLQVDLNVKF